MVDRNDDVDKKKLGFILILSYHRFQRGFFEFNFIERNILFSLKGGLDLNIPINNFLPRFKSNVTTANAMSRDISF